MDGLFDKLSLRAAGGGAGGGGSSRRSLGRITRKIKVISQLDLAVVRLEKGALDDELLAETPGPESGVAVDVDAARLSFAQSDLAGRANRDQSGGDHRFPGLRDGPSGL